MAAPLTLEQLTKLPSPRVPKGGDKVHKDECVFCFENLESKDGLYVCMSTFLSFCREHVLRHYQTASTPLFLNMKVIKTKKPKEEIENLEKPTKMAIGVEGGFEVEDAHLYNTQELNKLVVLPDFSELTLPNPSLPPKVLDSITAIIAADSAARQEDIAAWDGEQKFISKHADNLTQLNNGVKVPPSGWKCSRCDLKDNLWMNLTDGSILCGRKYFDGSGGNNHALEYNKETGYPLAVKLGTITPNGADVYSYDEDAMVEDPHLAMHLAHFGINMLMMEKTDKTMTELEIDLNTRVWEWDAIQEAGSKLKPLYGPGYTGLKNLGNSCYMNSVLQVLFTIPDFVQRYSNKIEELLSTAPSDATGDFNVQMAKFGHGILSGKYSKAPPAEEGEEGDVLSLHQRVKRDALDHFTSIQSDDGCRQRTAENLYCGQDGIAPRMLKTLVGRGHQEFATNKQQDAYEYLLHLFSLIERNSVSKPNPCDSLKFEVQERIECAQSKQVRYTNRNDFVLSLPIPVEAATNIDEVTASEARREDTKAEAGDRKQPGPATRLKVPFTACLEKFAASESVEDFLSPATKVKGIAHRITRFGTFPDYLIVHFRKFTLGEDWVPKKLDVSVDVPDVLDLTSLRGQGLQPGEVELPEGETAAEPEIEIDESVVEQLVAMGFHPEGCRKAVYHTKNSGSEAAMNWVLEHMEDPDFTEPLQKKQKTGSEQPISEESLVMIQSMGFTMDQAMKALRATTASEQPISEESLAMIQSMGFTMDQAMKALRATDNNVERALEWIFSHMDELNSEAMETDSAASTSQPGTRDGSGKYKLMAFISHMGKSTSSGHYVCHILKEGRWVIYNDRKVAQSEKPPKDLGYLYFYQRM